MMDRKEIRRRSQQQEKRMAKKVGGTTNAGSGSGWRRQNDVREDDVLWEMKRTDKQSISIALKDWEKLRTNALTEDRMPAMHLEIGRRRLVVLSEDDYMEMRDRG